MTVQMSQTLDLIQNVHYCGYEMGMFFDGTYTCM